MPCFSLYIGYQIKFEKMRDILQQNVTLLGIKKKETRKHVGFFISWEFTVRAPLPMPPSQETRPYQGIISNHVPLNKA